MVRFTGTGYSARPPQGNNWYIERSNPHAVLFGKLFPDKAETYHTFVAGVLVWNAEVKKVDSPGEFPKAVEELLIARLNEGRFRLITLKVAPLGPQESYCSSLDAAQEERDNEGAPGVVLYITAHGFLCLDTSSQFIVHAFYSERRALGSTTFLNDALRQEAEGFLNDVVVTPLH